MKEPVGIQGFLDLRKKAGELAQLTTEFLEKGYTHEEITKTIAEMYLRELYRRITPEAIEHIPRNSYNQPKLDKTTAVEFICFAFISTLIAALGSFLAKRHQ